MPSPKQSKFSHTCVKCKRTLPESEFMRMPTAAQLLRRHQDATSKGLDPSRSDVLEFSQAELADALAKSREFNRVPHTKKVHGNTSRDKKPVAQKHLPLDQRDPHALCHYKGFGGRKEVSNTCLECRPQAPFAGDLSTSAGRAFARTSGALAPTILQSELIIEAFQKKHKEMFGKEHAVTKMRREVVEVLAQAISNELRSVRNKVYYAQRGTKGTEPELLAVLFAYRSFVQALLRFVQGDLKVLPGVMWQAVKRKGLEQVTPEWVLPLAALSSRDELYCLIEGPLVTAAHLHQQTALSTGIALKLPYLALGSSQEAAILGMLRVVHDALRADGLSPDRDAVLKHQRGGDEFLGSVPSRQWVPRLELVVQQERQRVESFERALYRSLSKGPIVPEPDGAGFDE